MHPWKLHARRLAKYSLSNLRDLADKEHLSTKGTKAALVTRITRLQHNRFMDNMENAYRKGTQYTEVDLKRMRKEEKKIKY